MRNVFLLFMKYKGYTLVKIDKLPTIKFILINKIITPIGT